MAKLKEETIEKIVYSGTNKQVVYREIYKIGDIVARILISTDFPKTFGATIETLDKSTGKWNELYKLHKSLLNVYQEPSYEYFEEPSQLKLKENFFIGKFSKDVSNLKLVLTKLLLT